jgi:hybrid cluster-associated redox disulfide protein
MAGITRDTNIADVVRICPNAPEIFGRFGMGCLGCLAAQAETIGEGAEMHGVDAQKLVDELNSSCEKS